LNIYASFGTFGFWSAFLKGRGDVIGATGTSVTPHYVTYGASIYLKKWIFLNDPCYTILPNKTLVVLDECKGNT